jgi:hypothetical protein
MSFQRVYPDPLELPIIEARGRGPGTIFEAVT